MTGFKSFGDRTVTIKLSQGFTCVVGPNGAGKSNIIDALCFALGRLSKKTMRAEKLEDLIFAGSRGHNPSNRASVTLSFDNSDSSLPGGTSEFEITRVVIRGKGNQYKMNGKRVTRQQILNVLAAANIDPDGSNQFVLQGKIMELTHMNTEDRRRFIEELIGLQKYDDMKDDTLKELEKAERDLGQFEAIFKEVSSQLKKVEKEKNDAIAWRELDQKIKDLNVKLIALKISKLKEEEEAIEKKIEQSQKLIEEFEEKISRQEETLKQESLIMDNIQKTINEREIERDSINEQITLLKTELSSNQTTSNLAIKSIEKLKKEKNKLENLQMVLEDGQNYDSLINDIKTEIDSIKIKIEGAKKEIEVKQQNQLKIDEQLNNTEEEKSILKADISKFKQEISSKEASINGLKENIKKNINKKEKREEELSNLKGEAESVENAIKLVKDEENKIRKEIDVIKSQISEENENRKDLENNINSKQQEKNKINSNISEIKSTLSSISTEIKMHKENILNLENKKQIINQKIEDISKGTEIEKALKKILENRKNLNQELEVLKKKKKEEDFEFRKNEKSLELLKMKQNAFLSEINDNQSKISNLETKTKLFQNELTKLERENRNLVSHIEDLNKNIEENDKNIENLNYRKDNVIHRLEELNAEKKRIQDRINNAEQEYEKDKSDINGILQILNMLTQNINISVESIKSNIQQSNSEAIDFSAEDFKKFILDIIDMMKTIEDVKNESKTEEITPVLDSMIQTLSLFNDNADQTIEQLVYRIKESVDVAVQDSTSNFDHFVQDLMEILENVHLSLRKLTVSKSQDLYKQVEEISENIQEQAEDVNEIMMNISELQIQNIHYNKDKVTSQSKLEEILKRISELNEKNNNSNKEIEERNTIIKERKTQEEEINKEIDDLKKIKEDHWRISSEIQEELEEKQNKVSEYEQKLQDLKGIETLFENLEEINQNIEKIKKSIEDKKISMIDIEEKIKNKNTDLDTIQNEIEILNNKKENFWEINKSLQEKIEEKNKNLEKTLDRLRSLENIMRLINSIEELKNENIEAEKKIKENNARIEEVKIKIENIQKEVDEKQKIIDALRKDKSKEIKTQKSAQESLNNLNKELQETQIKLNELNKNKEREEKIISLTSEIEQTENQIKDVTVKIKEIEIKLTEINIKKTEKQNEINQYIAQKDESWKKQKHYQKIYTDLKSDFSMEKSKLNNLESKKIITNDQIETLFQRSKDYGSLPRIIDKISENELEKEIVSTTKLRELLEPVNLKAIDQYDNVKERFDEIDMRRQTIQRERKSILDAIDRIELEKTQSFMKAYHEINREFSQIFKKLSPGGSSKMILDRPDKPFEGGISIEARPRGKKISSLEILSGGEKTLVALSFIFSIQEFYPAPFYILDEIDAALDGPNVHRVSTVIQEFSSQAQFIVISHREENIVNAERIYGVSMQKSGITDVFSVDLEKEAKRLLETEDAEVVEE
ncbi:MAG: chromosome segregation protein SMC [Candidatus Lokiarchaeota archaeon]|nr:chromosome segregation protein SMC [Candidatus Lokiarchaeota archaeon]